jgi:hypothetical protein
VRLIVAAKESKESKGVAMLTATLRTDDGETVGILVLSEKVFASGKRGYFGQGKMAIGGVRYQAQAQLVAIGAIAAKDTGKATNDG